MVSLKSSEKTPVTRVFSTGTHLSAESTVAMRIECLAQKHNILMNPDFEPLIAVFRHRHLAHMTYVLQPSDTHIHIQHEPKVVFAVINLLLLAKYNLHKYSLYQT